MARASRLHGTAALAKGDRDIALRNCPGAQGKGVPTFYLRLLVEADFNRVRATNAPAHFRPSTAQRVS